MPMYEYKCGKCGTVTTVMQRMGAGPGGLSCPECKGSDLKKLISITFTVESVKSMPSGMEAAGASMPKGLGGMGGGCGGGMCGSGMCGM